METNKNESRTTEDHELSEHQKRRAALRRARPDRRSNNVGKSTICEALDLELGPDCISKFPPVEEFDFHNAHYLAPAAIEGEEPMPVPIKIEVVLVDINPEVENRCGHHLEFWHSTEKRLLDEGEVDAANPPMIVSCLRLETEAVYNPEEDEFEAKTCYSRSPNADRGRVGLPSSIFEHAQVEGDAARPRGSEVTSRVQTTASVSQKLFSCDEERIESRRSTSRSSSSARSRRSSRSAAHARVPEHVGRSAC